MIKIVQCWDDGVVDALRLCEILREAGARASFNLNPALHTAERSGGWRHKDVKLVQRLATSELVGAYKGFTIANHTSTHPWATKIPLEDWRKEVTEARKELQDLFGQPVLGFAYPFGNFSPETAEVVREAGHVYARTCENATPCYPAADPMRQPSDCHFASPDFWTLYEQAKAAEAPVFYFWGHSYEMITDADWTAFSDKIARFNSDPDAVWADLPDALTTIPG
ncbi:MAG: polysaccharide deacetylase family protein [Terrimicrobiaceae bacterium]